MKRRKSFKEIWQFKNKKKQGRKKHNYKNAWKNKKEERRYGENKTTNQRNKYGSCDIIDYIST